MFWKKNKHVVLSITTLQRHDNATQGNVFSSSFWACQPFFACGKFMRKSIACGVELMYAIYFSCEVQFSHSLDINCLSTFAYGNSNISQLCLMLRDVDHFTWSSRFYIEFLTTPVISNEHEDTFAVQFN